MVCTTTVEVTIRTRVSFAIDLEANETVTTLRNRAQLAATVIATAAMKRAVSRGAILELGLDPSIRERFEVGVPIEVTAGRTVIE